MRGASKIDPTCNGSALAEAAGGSEDDSLHIPDFSVESKETSEEVSSSQTDDNHQLPSLLIRSKAERRTSTTLEPDPDQLSGGKSSTRRRSVTSGNSVGVAAEKSVGLDQPRARSLSSDSAMDKSLSRSKRMWKAINAASGEINKDTRRVLGFFRNRLRGKRGQKETSVKEISIHQEDMEDKWASRAPPTSSTSRESSGSMQYSSSSSRESSTLVHVVHDMDDEYNPEYR